MGTGDEHVIFSLNGSEAADWMEVWCFRCEVDHDMTHQGGCEEVGCSLLVKMVLGEDVPQFTPHGDQWFRTIPATVACAEFKRCTLCPPDPPDAERRGGETRREFHDRLRADTMALPVVTP